MLHICLIDNIQIILSVGKLYCHITVTDMLLGQIPICCKLSDRYLSYNCDRYLSYNCDKYLSHNCDRYVMGPNSYMLQICDRYLSYNCDRYLSHNCDRYLSHNCDRYVMGSNSYMLQICDRYFRTYILQIFYRTVTYICHISVSLVRDAQLMICSGFFLFIFHTVVTKSIPNLYIFLKRHSTQRGTRMRL
jgi:hypothetical protein